MNRKLDTKWLGNGTEKSEKGRILEVIADKSTLPDLKSISAKADAARAKIKALNEDSTFSKLLSYRKEQMIDIIRDEEKMNLILKSLTGTGGANNMKKWTNFKEKYIDKFADISDLENNHYSLNWSVSKSHDTNESLGAERIAYELCYQLNKIDIDKLRKLVNSDDKKIKDLIKANKYEKTLKNDKKIYEKDVKKGAAADVNDSNINWIDKLDEYLKEIKKYVNAMTNRKYLSSEANIIEYREFAEKTAIFDFDVLENLINHLKVDENDTTIEFINELGQWKEDQIWHIWTASSLSQEEKEKLIKNRRIPASLKNVPVWWSDDEGRRQGERRNRGKGEDVQIQGLRGWFKLYRAMFENSTNRDKFIKSQNYIKLYNEMVEGLIYDKGYFDEKKKKWEKSDFKTTPTYTDSRIIVCDDYGEEVANIDAFYDLIEQIREIREDQKALEAKKSDFGKSKEGTSAARAEDEHNMKIREQIEILEKEDKEIDEKVAKKSIKEKQIRLNALEKTLNAQNVDWKSNSIILTALKAKKMLLDIAWLQNNGTNSRSFREDSNLGITKEIAEKNEKLLGDIQKEQNSNIGAWILVTKTEFESKGSNNTERINKTRDEEHEEGIGLRETEGSFRSLGDAKDIEVADLLDKEFKKITISPDSPSLSTSDLNWALGISDSTEAMVNDWGNLPNAFGKDKNKINDLVKNYNSSETKKTELMTFVKTLKHAEVEAATSEDDKFVAFKKRKAEEVVKDILKYENQEVLKNPDKRETLVNKMKTASGTGYNANPKENKFNKERYGNYEEPKKITEEQIIQFLFDEKMGSFTEKNTTWSDSQEENAFVKHMKAYYGWYIGGILLLIVAVVAIFWKNISEWWNGPSEEGIETEKNQEEDNE